MASNPKTENLSLSHGPDHPQVPRCLTTVDQYLQHHLSSQHWHETLGGETKQRTKGVETSLQNHPTTCQTSHKVPLNKKHRPFKKEYLPGWTEEVFLVTKVRRLPIPSYKVSEWDGTPIKGTFYEQDLQKVQADDDSLFRVEKILKRKKGQVLVRWKGWPSKYDSWIPADNGKKKNKTA